MTRTNRKHNRQIEKHRRNKGPEVFSRAADKELKKKADKMAEGLSAATIEHGDVAAASLLLTLAESVRSKDKAGAFERVFSLADKWATEPQVVMVDTATQLPVTLQPKLLTDGASTAEDSSGIVDAEWEPVAGETPPGSSS